MQNKIQRVVIDTNLWISFLISDKYNHLDKLLLNKKIKVIFSAELLEEFTAVVFRPKFRKYFNETEIDHLLTHLSTHSEFVKVKSKTNICRDLKDNFLLSLCEDGKVDYLITGDEDLLILKKYKRTSILRISDYFKL